MTPAAGRVVVVGSANVDHVVRVDHLPRPGETVLGTAYAEHMGGKGANQAVAAARLGATVTFLGAVGADAAGDRALEALAREGIDCSDVARVEGGTGAAVIVVDAAGENQIAVASGANQLVDPDRVAARIAELRPAVVLAVLEVPMTVVIAAGRASRSVVARLVLNASPPRDLPAELLASGPCVAVNAHELQTAGASVEALLERGASAVIVTRGAGGALLRTSDGGDVVMPGEAVGAVVDATGAGDTFAGGLAAFLAQGIGLERAARMANVAAALSVLREGARGGMPSRSELDDRLRGSPSV